MNHTGTKYTMEYNNTKNRVKLSDEEVKALLTKHQYNEPLSKKEHDDLWQYIANFTRNLERRYFGKQDSAKELDLHHERILYIYDYLQQRRRFKRDEVCELLPNGKLKCRSIWIENEEKTSPFLALYKLKLTWSAHEAVIRLDALGITEKTFGVEERNIYEFAETPFVRYDVVSTLKMQRLYEEYDREKLIELALENNPLSKRHRKYAYASERVGVEPFVDALLFAVGHRYGYKQYNESQQAYDYFKSPQGTKGRKIWTQSVGGY